MEAKSSWVILLLRKMLIFILWLEMGIIFWINNIFEKERTFSWKTVSIRKKLTMEEQNGSLRVFKNYYFLKTNKKINIKRFKIVRTNLQKR